MNDACCKTAMSLRFNPLEHVTGLFAVKNRVFRLFRPKSNMTNLKEASSEFSEKCWWK